MVVEEEQKAEASRLKEIEREAKRRKKEENMKLKEAERAQRLEELASYIERLQALNIAPPQAIIEGKRLPQKQELKELCSKDPDLEGLFKASMSVKAVWELVKEHLSSGDSEGADS